jgi:hypothetical protein
MILVTGENQESIARSVLPLVCVCCPLVHRYARLLPYCEEGAACKFAALARCQRIAGWGRADAQCGLVVAFVQLDVSPYAAFTQLG